MTILITGAHGFLGSHLQKKLLQAGIPFLAPTKKQLNLIEPPVLSGNVVDNLIYYMHDYGPIHIVVHLAAYCGGIGKNRENPGRMIYENLQMGLNILEAIRHYNTNCKLINIGSVCMYPYTTELPFREDNIWNGYPETTNAPYGIAKRAIIEASIAYHKQYGIPVWNLVPVNMVGEYEHFDLQNSHVIPAMIQKFFDARKNGNPVELWGNGSPTREFIYAGDVAEAIMCAIKYDNNSPGWISPINIGTGKEISIAELAYKIRNKIAPHIDIRWLTDKPNGQPRRCLDIGWAKRILGFEAQTSLDDALDATISWYEHCRITKCVKQ